MLMLKNRKSFSTFTATNFVASVFAGLGCCLIVSACSSSTPPPPAAEAVVAPQAADPVPLDQEEKKASTSETAVAWENGHVDLRTSFDGNEWVIIAHGNLPNGCYKWSHVEVKELSKNSFDLTPFVYTRGPTALCPMMLLPFEDKVKLPTSLKSGNTYHFHIVRSSSSKTAIDIKIPKTHK